MCDVIGAQKRTRTFADEDREEKEEEFKEYLINVVQESSDYHTIPPLRYKSHPLLD